MSSEANAFDASRIPEIKRHSHRRRLLFGRLSHQLEKIFKRKLPRTVTSAAITGSFRSSTFTTPCLLRFANTSHMSHAGRGSQKQL